MGRTYTSHLQWKGALDRRLYNIPRIVRIQQQRIIDTIYIPKMRSLVSGTISLDELEQMGHPYGRDRRGGGTFRKTKFINGQAVRVTGTRKTVTKWQLTSKQKRRNGAWMSFRGRKARVDAITGAAPVLPINRQSKSLIMDIQALRYNMGLRVYHYIGFRNSKRYYRFILSRRGTKRQIARPIRREMWRFIKRRNIHWLRRAQRIGIQILS